MLKYQKNNKSNIRKLNMSKLHIKRLNIKKFQLNTIKSLLRLIKFQQNITSPQKNTITIKYLLSIMWSTKKQFMSQNTN
jgi:hypothetical protein